MTSAAQVRANCSNARKSTGPRTPEGKATASRNAVKHGLLAEQVVIHGEDPAEFERYREGMLAELAPVGAVEEMLAERAVSLSWRLRRAERLQSAVFARVYRENANDVVLWPKHGLPIQPGPGEDEVVLGQVVMADFAHAQVLDRLLVYERRIESSLYRTMAQLRKEWEARTAAAEPEEGSRSQGNLAAREEPVARAKLGSFGANLLPEGAAGMAASEGVSLWEAFPPVGQESATLAKLGSFGANVAPGVQPRSHRQDADATKAHGRDARATKALHASRSILRNEANFRGQARLARVERPVTTRASTQKPDEPLLFATGRQSD